MADVALTWQELAELPRRLNEAQTAFVALRPLVSTPRAAASTGSSPASVAISAFGGLLVQFLADTAQAIEADIATVRRVEARYRAADDTIAVRAAAVRAELTVVGAADDVVLPAAAITVAGADGVQSVARPARESLRATSAAVRADVRRSLDGTIGRDASGAVAAVLTMPYDAGATLLDGVDIASEAVEDAAVAAATTARELAGRADRYLRVERPSP